MIATETSMPVWIEIDLKAFINNIRVIRKLVNKETKIMGVVKFNAYGHGAVKIAKILIENGIDALGVSSVEEGIELRSAGIEAPILIMNHSIPESAAEIIENNLTPMVCSIDLADELDRCSRLTQIKKEIQIRVDVCNSNIGVKPVHFLSFLEELKKRESLIVSGIFTHLISAYSGNELTLKEELEGFQKVLPLIREDIYHDLIIHAFSSPAIFRLSEVNFPMIRTGTSLYGLPSYQDQDMKGIEPIMQLKARIIDIRSNDALVHKEYTGITSLEKHIRTALIPVGYGTASYLINMKAGSVLVNGTKVPILGGAFMGHMIIDVSQVPEVKIGDVVVILGKQLNERITAQELAETCGISVEKCESVCLLDKRVKRIFHY